MNASIWTLSRTHFVKQRLDYITRDREWDFKCFPDYSDLIESDFDDDRWELIDFSVSRPGRLRNIASAGCRQ